MRCARLGRSAFSHCMIHLCMLMQVCTQHKIFEPLWSVWTAESQESSMQTAVHGLSSWSCQRRTVHEVQWSLCLAICCIVKCSATVNWHAKATLNLLLTACQTISAKTWSLLLMCSGKLDMAAGHYNLPTMLPICTKCKSAGFKAVCTHPFGKARGKNLMQ